MSLNPMDWIAEGVDYILYNFIYRLFYYLEIAFCLALNWLQELMDVFTGASMVTYKTNFGSTQNYLINIFFSNGAISGAYWGMAAIGIVLAFVFAIISVIRKTFDSSDKVKMSIGQILTNLFKSIFLIISLNVGMTVIITATNVLMQSVTFVFDHSTEIANGEDHIDFTDEEYAAMARVFNTVGNYSLNPSYKNRYNINACYNEIRGDLKYLADQGVFDYYYETTDENGNIVVTWQSALQEIANAADYTKEAPVDVYNEGIANALYDCMTVLKTDASLSALKSFDRVEAYDADQVYLGRVIFLTGTMGNGITAAAKNDAYNNHPSMTDPVRAPYYRGSKSIFNISQVNKDFDISITRTNYIIVYIAGAALVMNMALVLVSAVARIFNLLFLYLVAPPLFAVIPLDDGAKVKQWMTAFVVQSFSIFGTVISMRIYLIFVPIIMDPGLVLSENIIIDMIGRLILIYAGIEAVNKANAVLTGILADSAGWQSIQAGDMKSYLGGSFAGKLMGRGMSAVNEMPAKALGGEKFANFLNGRQNAKDAKAGGLAGFGMGVVNGMLSGAKGGANAARGAGAAGAPGAGGAAGTPGAAGAAGAAGASNNDKGGQLPNQTQKNSLPGAGGAAGGLGNSLGGGGNQGGGNGPAETPPPQRNT